MPTNVGSGSSKGTSRRAREAAPGEAPGGPQPPKGFRLLLRVQPEALQARSRAADPTERLTWATVWTEAAVG